MNNLKLLEASLRLWYPAGTLPSKILGFQTVRWRKPRWVPKAPSKEFLITRRKRPPPDEDKEILRLYQNWRAFMRMNMEHCHAENLKQEEFGKLSHHALEQEELEHRQLMEYNQKENERLVALRKERQAKEEEEMLETIMKEKAEAAVQAGIQKEIALQTLQNTEKLVTTFIKREELEEVIIRAMNNPVDYNFAIDEDGRMYEGVTSRPETVDINILKKFPVKDEGITNVF